jgi:rod shape-determining protein MreC
LARDRTSEDFFAPVRRLLVGVLVLALVGVFVLWRADSPRIERLRMAMIDGMVPSFAWVMAPVTGLSRLVDDFQSYQQLAAQNQDLRRELQQMKAWKEAALQLEQQNAKLIDLNNVRLDPNLTFVTGVVVTDSGSPFRQSVLVNVGRRDGIVDGWPTMDGIGLVGRIAGVGQNTSRVLLLTDTSSRIPITILPSGQKAILAGDNTLNPPIDFLEDRAVVRPGDRVVSSGDGGVFPADLLIGQVALGTDNRLRVRLAADYQRLEFLRVLRAQPHEPIDSPTGILTAPDTFIGPPAPPATAALTASSTDG